MIHVEALTKRYGATEAVRGVSFHVHPGEILGFLGPNGAGKTTTLRIITGFLPATEGAVSVGGVDIFESPTEAKRQIGYLPENPPLYTELTVQEQLAFVARLRGLPRRRRRGAVDEALERAGLTEVRRRLIANLSKGYRQRVGLGQALVGSPPVLVLDEPTVGLDPKQIIEIRELIRALAGDHTVILSSHILPEVRATCERVVIIHRGRVVATDTFDTLAARLRDTFKVRVAVARPAPEVERALGAVPDVVAVSPDGDGAWVVETPAEVDRREQIAEAVVSGGFGLLALEPQSLSLEEVFLQLTTEEGLPEEAAA
ncbi:MAG: ATP-binding cassette domain-containing protein [Nitrospirae bacterium]|nr:MAG: ATP-binding cassette domain-containing protein [Nitrospirota bacterium]